MFLSTRKAAIARQAEIPALLELMILCGGLNSKRIQMEYVRDRSSDEKSHGGWGAGALL